MDLEEDKDLLYIARDGLKASLPEHWRICRTKEGEIYYFNLETSESKLEHPLDDYYKKQYLSKKNLKKRNKEKKEEQKFQKQPQKHQKFMTNSNSQNNIMIQNQIAGSNAINMSTVTLGQLCNQNRSFNSYANDSSMLSYSTATNNQTYFGSVNASGNKKNSKLKIRQSTH